MKLSQPIKNLILALILGAAFVSIWGWLFWLVQRNDHFEPDRLYHFSLLREMISQSRGVIREWAQLPFLGWSEYFTNKEFLFHLLLYLPMQVGGELVVLGTVMLFSALLIVSFYWLVPEAKGWAVCLAFAVFFNPYIQFRFSLLRPHVFAVLLFQFFVAALYFRRSYFAFVAGALFSLSYHAFYLPLSLALCFLAGSLATKSKREQRSELWRPALVGSLGVILGIILHPYFPSNVVTGMQHLGIAIRIESLFHKMNILMGAELSGFSISRFSHYFLGLVLIILGSIAFHISSVRPRKVKLEWWILSVFVLTLWFGALQSARSLEFAFPLTVMILWQVAVDARKHTKWAAPLLVGSLFLAQVPSMIPMFSTHWHGDRHTSPSPEIFERLLRPIPKNYSGVIYHTNFGVGPYITYLRPKAKAVEVLDPTFLLLHDRHRFFLSQHLVHGSVKDPVAAIQKSFLSRYAIVENVPLLGQLMKHPQAKLLAISEDQYFYLFDLGEVAKN